MAKTNKKNTQENRTRGGGDIFSQLKGLNMPGITVTEKPKDSMKAGSKTTSKPTSKTNTSDPHAPYNFVRFGSKVIEADNQVSLSEISDQYLTGEITYSFRAETPLMVDDGTGQFYRNARGKLAVPGSTMRGLIRNNAQILGMADVRDDIEDYSLMYREIAAGVEKKVYQQVLGVKPVKVGKNKSVQITVLENVKAGYLQKKNGRFLLFDTNPDRGEQLKGSGNYYIVSERMVLDESRKGFQDLIDSGTLQNRPKPGNSSFQKEVKNGRVHYIGTKNPQFKPLFKEISYITNGNQVSSVQLSSGLTHSGYVVFSGYMNEKKSFYIIPKCSDEPIKEEQSMIDQAIRAYEIDYNRKKIL